MPPFAQCGVPTRQTHLVQLPPSKLRASTRLPWARKMDGLSEIMLRARVVCGILNLPYHQTSPGSYMTGGSFLFDELLVQPPKTLCAPIKTHEAQSGK